MHSTDSCSVESEHMVKAGDEMLLSISPVKGGNGWNGNEQPV